ncbi:MAG: hypothetical protein KDA81_04015 [Planctomycetaceae bacterium]|nr:hypothetical protein [Planctomycetaceae bacterium]
MSSSIREGDELPDEVRESLPWKLQQGMHTFTVSLDAEAGIVQSEKFQTENRILYQQQDSSAFAIGSGTHGHTFVSYDQGCLFQLPLTWYRDTQVWDLSPGYEIGDRTGFNRRISDGCVFCHVGHINSEPAAEHRFRQPLLIEKGIGCERCHGPGTSHSEFHASMAPKSGATDPIRSAGALSPAARDSICYQCHLLGRERVLRTGHSESDFRPGDLISDHWVVLVSDHTVDNLRVASHPEQMVSSRCYQMSQGKMGCITCHDPHSKPEESERVHFYRSRCQTCHSDEESSCSADPASRVSENNSCIACHMPKAPASNVPHTARTKHLIVRHRKNHAGDPGEDSAASGIIPFERRTFPVTDQDLARAVGISFCRQALLVNSSTDAAIALDLLAPLMSQDDMLVLHCVAECMVLLGHRDKAVKLATECLEIVPDNERLLELAIRLADGSSPTRTLEMLDAYMRLNPRNSHMWRAKAIQLAAIGRLDGAISAGREACERDPREPSHYRLLAELLRAASRHDEASEFLSIANSLDHVSKKQRDRQR